MDICGIVVWYNPGIDELNNIKTYIKNLDRLLIIDNSNKDNSNMIKNLKEYNNIEYIPNLENLGIAKALNIGCEQAKKYGYKWALTMDQDSRFKKDEIKKYIEASMSKLNADKLISIFALKVCDDNNEKYGYVDKVITSGNILSLEAFTDVGGFDSDLFIDEVDHDICFKMIKSGYKIYKFSNFTLDHKLGNNKKFKILNKEFNTMNHNHTRKYYIIRNRCILKKRYPEYTGEYTKQNIVEVTKVILGEDDKLKKLKFMMQGYLDYKRNRYGKFKN